MDRKSIGSFIAVLRKAKGMTQKDLAELLHVSDKTVSRWETGEGTPDLALIPVLAEIFGVTCDELLRGERRPESSAAETTPLGEKRKQWLLNRAKLNWLIYNIIAAAVSVAGVLAMNLTGNMEAFWNRRYYISAIFCLVAVTLQVVSIVRLFAATGEPDAVVLEFRRKMVFYTECFAEVTVVCIAFSAAEYIDLYGWALAPIFAVVWVVLCLIVNTILRKKGVISDG